MPDNPSPTEDNTQDNDHQPTVPLGLKLTGYRLLTTVVILGVGIVKSVYQGQALISTSLDWLGGVIFALILFWLGEAKNPELYPRFYKDDYAPPILGFLCRPDVYIWFLSVLPLLPNTMHLRAMLDARRNHEHHPHNTLFLAYVIEDGLTLSVLAFSTSICMFCMQCVRVIWPRAFGDSRRQGLLYYINATMYSAYFHYAYWKIFVPEKYYDYPPSIVNLKIVVYNMLWMFPVTLLLPVYKQPPDIRKAYFAPLKYKSLLWAAFLVLVEVVLIKVWGFPDFPGSLYGISFSYGLVVFLLCRFFASVPTFWIPSFTDIRKAVYAKVGSSRNGNGFRY